jgi:hypothetical protein
MEYYEHLKIMSEQMEVGLDQSLRNRISKIHVC